MDKSNNLSLRTSRYKFISLILIQCLSLKYHKDILENILVTNYNQPTFKKTHRMGWMTIMAPWRTFPNSKWLFYCLYAKLRREVCQLFVRQINSPNPDLNWGPWTMHPAVEFLFSTLLISVAHLKDHRQCFGKNICSTLLLANGWWPPVQWVSGLTKEHKNINELAKQCA